MDDDISIWVPFDVYYMSESQYIMFYKMLHLCIMPIHLYIMNILGDLHMCFNILD